MNAPLKCTNSNSVSPSCQVRPTRYPALQLLDVEEEAVRAKSKLQGCQSDPSFVCVAPRAVSKPPTDERVSSNHVAL